MISIQKLNSRKNIALCLAFLIFLPSLPSCATEEAEPEILYPGETVLLEDGSPIYAEDAHLEEDVAKFFYDLRREGNPDPNWENSEIGTNGEDYLFELTESVYSLSCGPEEWGVHVYFVSDTYLTGPWHHKINLEKYENGKWVRQAILDSGRKAYSTQLAIEMAKYNGLLYDIYIKYWAELWQEGLAVLSPLTVKVDQICPAPTPGQYRFVFYAALWRESFDKNPLYRMYYIPFEVVE